MRGSRPGGLEPARTERGDLYHARPSLGTCAARAAHDGDYPLLEEETDMHFAKSFAVVTLAFAGLGLAGCGGGVEGTYKIDKAEMKKTMEAEVAKMPAEQQGFAKLALGLIDAMDMTIELQAGGKAKTKMTSPTLDPAKPGKTEEKEGTWKAEGETVEITTDGKSVKCTKGPNKLTCTGDKKGEPTLVLVKS
jgi:hypothetical protein